MMPRNISPVVSGKPGEAQRSTEIPRGTLNSIMKQAQLKR